MNARKDSGHRVSINMLGGALVGAFAAILSFDTLNRVAMQVGYRGSIEISDGLSLHNSWLLPLAIDIYAFIATRIWLSSPVGRLATYAARNAIGAISLSVVLNSVLHLFESLDWLIEDCPYLVIAVGGIPPVLVALVVHLNHLTKQQQVSALVDDQAGAWAELPGPMDPEDFARFDEPDFPPDPWAHAVPIGPAPAAAEPVSRPAGDNVSDKKPSARKPPPSSKEKVAAAHRRTPDAKNEELAARLGLSIKTIERHRPARVSAKLSDSELTKPLINGHVLQLEEVNR